MSLGSSGGGGVPSGSGGVPSGSGGVASGSGGSSGGVASGSVASGSGSRSSSSEASAAARPALVNVAAKMGKAEAEEMSGDQLSAPQSPTAIELSKLGDGDVKVTGGKWQPEEDERLREVVKEHGPKNWKVISKRAFNGARSDVQCLHRWQKVLRPGLVKGPWLAAEDEIIVHLIKTHGLGNIKWSEIAANLPGRLGKQCRERWVNHLDPELTKSSWSFAEDQLLMEKQQTLGNKWREIAAFLPGRSENSVKNRWNSARRKVIRSEANALAESKEALPAAEERGEEDALFGGGGEGGKAPKGKAAKRVVRLKGSALIKPPKATALAGGAPVSVGAGGVGGGKKKKSAEQLFKAAQEQQHAAHQEIQQLAHQQQMQQQQQQQMQQQQHQQMLAMQGQAAQDMAQYQMMAGGFGMMPDSQFMQAAAAQAAYGQLGGHRGMSPTFLNPIAHAGAGRGALSPGLNDLDMFFGTGKLGGLQNGGFCNMDGRFGGGLSPVFLNAMGSLAQQEAFGFGMGGFSAQPPPSSSSQRGLKKGQQHQQGSQGQQQQQQQQLQVNAHKHKQQLKHPEDLLDLYGTNESLLRSLASPPSMLPNFSLFALGGGPGVHDFPGVDAAAAAMHEPVGFGDQPAVALAKPSPVRAADGHTKKRPVTAIRAATPTPTGSTPEQADGKLAQEPQEAPQEAQAKSAAGAVAAAAVPAAAKASSATAASAPAADAADAAKPAAASASTKDSRAAARKKMTGLAIGKAIIESAEKVLASSRSPAAKRSRLADVPEDDKEGEEGPADFVIIGKSLTAKSKQAMRDDMSALEDKTFFKSRSRAEFSRAGEDVEVLGLSTEHHDQDDMFELFTFDDLVGDLVD